MADDNKPRMNDAAVGNVVLALTISMLGLFSVIGWLFNGDGEIPTLFILVTLAPLGWGWMHREAWANRHE